MAKDHNPTEVLGVNRCHKLLCEFHCCRCFKHAHNKVWCQRLLDAALGLRVALCQMECMIQQLTSAVLLQPVQQLAFLLRLGRLLLLILTCAAAAVDNNT
jgi:hypothetical protein